MFYIEFVQCFIYNNTKEVSKGTTKMKTWKKPEIVTISENELKKIITAGACSLYDICTSGYLVPKQ